MFTELISELLQGGFAVKFKASGRSMHPTILEGETITVEPLSSGSIQVGDVVLYRCNTRVVAHRVVSIMKFTERSIETSKYEAPAGTAESNHLKSELNSGSVVCYVQPVDEDIACSAQSVAEVEFRKGAAAAAAGPSFAESSRSLKTTGSSSPVAGDEALLACPQGQDVSETPQEHSCLYILRGDAATSCDDPVHPEQVLGKVVCVQRNGSRINLCSRKAKWKAVVCSWKAALERRLRRRKAATDSVV